MDKKYLINEDTLNSIAQAIRLQENSGETIATTDFAKRIEAIEPTVEDYMRLSDYVDYPKYINELDYSSDAIDACRNYISFYEEMEENDG